MPAASKPIAPATAYLLMSLTALLWAGGTRASAFFHLRPLFTAVLASVFLAEPWQFYHAGGFTLILAGIWLTARSA